VSSEHGGLSGLAGLIEALGPVALVGLETSGSLHSRSAEILEIGVILIDPGRGEPLPLWARLGAEPSTPLGNSRIPGAGWEDPPGAPEAGSGEIAEALRGRTLIAHDAAPPRHFLARNISPALARARFLDLRDLLALTHPDAADWEFASATRLLLGREPGSRPLSRAGDLLELLLGIAAESATGEARYRHARSAFERYRSDSPWLTLLANGGVAKEDLPQREQFVTIGETPEAPVPWDVEAIAEVLADEKRGARYFPGYRARSEQIELMRGFFRNLAHGGRLLLEGGTGVGKSLAYLAAAIPFAMERVAAGERDPLVLSTRTKLLQDQLLEKDIAAAARMFGYPDLKALSIKGRANYICEKRLQETLSGGGDLDLLEEDRSAYSILLACARNRVGGEIASLPASLHGRYPILSDLIGVSVARRAEQCSREECAKRGRCPFGSRRKALGDAHILVANHDLLLRWPPDYPRLSHVIADEGHELAAIADDVYARVVRPEEIRERIDEIFGAPDGGAGRPEGESGLLPRKQRLEAARAIAEVRRSLSLDFAAIGRDVVARGNEYGEVQLPADAGRLFPIAARMAELAATRLEGAARLAEELDGRAEWSFDELPAADGEGPNPIQKHVEALREAAEGLRLAFAEAGEDVVAGFDRLALPHDRWVLSIRSVSPAAAFHEHFLQGLESFAAVSASLFVGGDAFAALGELELEERAAFGMERLSASSPFDYGNHMRVAALRSPTGPFDQVGEMARVLEILARLLGGRTLGLFTSLARMREVADRLVAEFADEPIEVLAPIRASDDAGGLVKRFRELPAGGILLGSRTFWQGIDIPGDDLQAVVIEKLPFEVPTELRRRREARIAELGQNAFERYRLGKMLLNLKQMTGRLIRGEGDRGLVVIVEARTDRGYFDQLGSAFPSACEIRIIETSELPDLVAELGIGPGLTLGDSES
jgi:ATP-dependent DNA helicase DinG